MGTIEPIFVLFGAAMIALLLLREAIRFTKLRLYAIPLLSLIPIVSLALVGGIDMPSLVEWGIVAISVLATGVALLLRFGRTCPRCGIPLKDKTLLHASPLVRHAWSTELAYCPSCGWGSESQSYDVDPGAYDRKLQAQVSAWRPEILDYVGQVGMKNPGVSPMNFLDWWELENRHGQREVPHDHAAQTAIMIEYFAARGVHSHRPD